MQIFSRTSVAVLLCSSLLAACTKETVRVEEKLPPAQIQSSAAVNKNSVTLQKSSLGKLFLLMPTMTTAARSAAPSLLQSMIVSFEQSGDRIAVYNRTTSDVQSDVTADVLIQSFQVISENSEQVVFDVGQGFKSLDGKAGLDIFFPSLYPMEHQIKTQKLEKALKIKDSFVKKLSLTNNSIYISQNIRMTVPFDSKLSDADKKTAAMLGEVSTEMEQAANLVIEIKPYQVNESFQPKEQDAKQRFGFFVSKQPSTDLYKVAKGQIIRWDTSEKAGPIKVFIDAKFPQHLKPALTSSLQYWNRIFGKDLLQLSSVQVSDEPQADRSIVIRWINWDKGDGAFAGVQYDPLTGESLRGYVYVTSAFTADAKFHEDGQPNEYGNFDSMSIFNGLCNVNVAPKALNQVNILNEVLSHELGHVLGLRHNFAGSLNASVSDQEIKESLVRFKKGDNSKPVALSSTTMDYLQMPESAILGEFMKSNALPYDQMAIDWAYKNIEKERTTNMYCSDEHIVSVSMDGRTFLGCSRQDTYKNVFFAEREKNLSTAAKSVDTAILALKMSKKYIATYGPGMAQGLLNYTPTLSIAEKLYPNEKIQILLVPDDVVPGYLESLNVWSVSTPNYSNAYNPAGDAKITEDLKAVGGMKAFISSLNPNTSVSPNYFENLVLNYPDLKGKIMNAGFNASDAELIAEGFLTKAKKLDQSEVEESLKKAIDISKLRKSEWKD